MCTSYYIDWVVSSSIPSDDLSHHRQETEPHLLGPHPVAAGAEAVDDELGGAARVEVGFGNPETGDQGRYLFNTHRNFDVPHTRPNIGY